MSTTLRNSKLIENCTPSIAYDNQVKAASTAFDRQMYEIIDDMNGVGVTDPVGDQPSFPKQGIIMIPSIMDIEDSNLIDILAWQFHVDFYDSTRDLEFRKNLVQKAITWHMRKGTVDLVQEVLDTYWPGGATLTEWFEYMNPLPPNYPTEPWHDRYRFRVYIDETIIDPATEAKVLQLIDRYKPVSRWPEGIFRATTSEGHIGVTGACLRFIYHLSDAPELEGFQADFYGLFGPTDATVGAASGQFSVGMPAGSAIADVIVITPNDGGKGGVFTPASITLTTAAPVGKFTYKPAISGTVSIATVNDGGLTDPPPISLVAKEIPETIAGLLGWWKSTSVTPVADASPIAGWPAKFGGFNALPPVPANAPAYYSGLVRGVRDTAARLETHPVNEDYLEELEEAEARAGTHPGIWFSGSSKLVFTPPIDLTGGWTVIALAYNTQDIKVFSSSTSAVAAPEVIDQNGPYSYLSDIGHRYSADFSAASPTNRFAIYCQTSDKSTGLVQMMCDGMTYPVIYGGGWPDGGPTIDQIGMRGDGSPSSAHFVEFMIYRGIKTPAELEVLHDYMRAEYGIALGAARFSGPAIGALAQPSTPFTVRLPFGTLPPVTVFTPNDGGAGGVFTPSSLTLSGGTPSGTFTYTPATEGVKTIAITNDAGLPNSPNLSYNAVVFVDTWSDKTAHVHHLTQPTANLRPFLVRDVANGRPAVKFSSGAAGVPVRMNVANPIPATGPWTIISLMIREGQIHALTALGYGNPRGLRMYPYGAGVWSVWNGLSNTNAAATDKSPACGIYTVDSSPSVWANGLGGPAVDSGVGGGTANPTWDTVGSDVPADQRSDGYIVAQLVCLALLTPTQRQNAEATLAAKYGIAVPAGTLIDLTTLPALEAWWEADTLLPLVIDTQSAEGFGSWSALDGGTTDTGGTFVSTGGKLFSVKMWLVKQGAPTGNVVCKIWSAAGVLLATSNPIPVALLPTTLLTTTEFTFPIAQQIALAAGTSYIVTAGAAGSPTDCVMGSYGGRSAASMAAIRNAAGGWVYYDTLAEPFIIYVTK